MDSICNRLSRRRFLAGLTTAAATTGLGLPAWAAARAKTGWTMKLSCSSINFMSLPLADACARIAALGFEAVDLWGPFGKCPHLDEAVALGPEGLKRLLAKNKLALYAFSVYAGGYARYADLLGRMGGGVAVRGSRGGACDPKDVTAAMKTFLESLKPELELAEKYNSYLAIENHGRALLDSLDSFKAFVDLNRNPRLGIAMAPYHLQRAGVSVPEAIAASGRQLLFFYAWQDGAGENQLPGIGPADCKPWIEALARIDYRWYVNPFMHHEPAPDEMSKAHTRSIAYLKSCADAS